MFYYPRASPQLFYLGHHLKFKNSMQIKFLQDFYGLVSENSRKFKTHKAGSIIEINADADGVPTNTFWYEQLRFEENKAFFEIQTPSTTKKTK